MYAFRVSPHVENLIKECAARLITSGVPVSQSVFFFECGGSSRFGYCKKGDAKGASGFEYSIVLIILGDFSPQGYFMFATAVYLPRLPAYK